MASIISHVLLLLVGVILTEGSTREVENCRCFHIYRPVCADDGHTYGNHCEARCQGVNVVQRGRCRHENTGIQAAQAGGVTRKCFCGARYRPVCGYDGRTYPNRCAAFCRDVSVEHDGRCSEQRENSGRDCRCPPISSYVCGEDEETYENACIARCRDVRIVSRGACSNFETGQVVEGSEGCVCPPLYNPVCGEDGITYDSPCQAKCLNKKISSHGGCAAPPEKPPCYCNMMWQPVCAENGRTYPNPCRANCDGQRYTEGRCGRHHD